MFSVGLRKELITTLEDIGEVMHSVQMQIWTRLKNVLLTILSIALGTHKYVDADGRNEREV